MATVIENILLIGDNTEIQSVSSIINYEISYLFLFEFRPIAVLRILHF